MYYEAYFELQEAPFSISPDPRYLYLTQNHREALAHLLYGVSSNGGFVLLTGEIGAGKTTVCQCLLEQLPDNTDVAYILNPKLQPWEFLATICDELGITYASDDTSLKHYIDLIHHYLLKAHSQGRNTVLMVDEAQNLSTELIEHLRLLTNLETREKKLLQIMLVGQPELRDKIALPEMQQMAQRITARYHLGPLSKSEVAAYVRHRLKVAGATRELFSQDSLNQLWKLTGGVPRLINIICDRSLLGTYTRKGHRVERPVLEDAASEVLGRDIHRSPVRSKSVLWGALALILAAVAFLSAYYSRDLLPGNQVVSWAVPVKTDEFAEPVAEDSGEAVPEIQPEEVPAEMATDIAVVTEPAEPVVEASPITDQNDGASLPVEAVTLPVQVEDPTDNVNLDLPEVEAIIPETQFSFPVDLSDAALTESAFGALFRRWKIDYVPASGVSPCEFAVTRQLACAESQGNLPILVKINRPALLTLYDDAGRAYPAALIGVSRGEAVMVLAGELLRIPVQSLSKWWYGEYLLLWQMPPRYSRALVKGDSGSAIVWLLQQLGETIADEAQTASFDEALEQRVKLFQRSNGLIPDGVAGPRTIMALNNLSGIDVPRLTEAAKE